MCLISWRLEPLNNSLLAVSVLYYLWPFHCVESNYKGPSVYFSCAKTIAKADHQLQDSFFCSLETEQQLTDRCWKLFPLGLWIQDQSCFPCALCSHSSYESQIKRFIWQPQRMYFCALGEEERYLLPAPPISSPLVLWTFSCPSLWKAA